MPLTEPEAAVVAAIVAGPVAWSSSTELDAAGHPITLLEQMAEADLLACWHLPTGCVWTLSAYSAALAGVKIVTERGLLRWLGPGSTAPPLRRPEGWDPWCWTPPPAKRVWLIDEVWDVEVVLFGQRVGIDPRPGRKPVPTTRRGIRRRSGKTAAPVAATRTR